MMTVLTARVDEAVVAAVLAAGGTFLVLFAAGAWLMDLARGGRVDLTRRLRRRERGNGRGSGV